MTPTVAARRLTPVIGLALLTSCASAPPPQSVDQAKQFRNMWDDIYENLKPEIQRGNITVERGGTRAAGAKLTSLDTARRESQASAATQGQNNSADRPGTASPNATASSTSAGDDTPYREYIRVRLTDRVLFDSGADQVSPEGIDVLTRLGAILKAERDIEITIQGHTDNRPIRERLRPKFPDNMALSQARAANASQILKNSGVQQDALVLKWFGETSYDQ